MASARRIKFVHWVRKTHGWFGLWGAILGLMTGFSGFWLNHRAVLKVELPDQQQINAQVTLPDPAPTTPATMGTWLGETLRIAGSPNVVRVEKARPLPWTEDRSLMQPERWLFTFGGPNRVIQAEYWSGSKSVGVRTTENGIVATLTNLHKGVGMPIAWILLIDTLAGSLIFLSISGVILWVETSRKRLLGASIFGVSVIATVVLALGSVQS
jgi:hypothetical protein